MKYLDILQAGITKKKKGRSYYSNNALARDLNISGAFLSMILNGKKEISSDLAFKICEKLDFDRFTKNDFLRNLLLNKYKNSIFEKLITESNMDNVEAFLPLIDKESKILEKWYYLPILEYITCQNFNEDMDHIASKFNMAKEEVIESFFVLENEGLIGRDEKGNLFKKDQFLRVPTKRSHPLIRSFHTQMINRAVENLNNKTSDSDYNERLATGLTIAVDPQKIEKAKEIIEKALHLAGAELSNGNCSKVYQLNIQLFPHG